MSKLRRKNLGSNNSITPSYATEKNDLEYVSFLHVLEVRLEVEIQIPLRNGLATVVFDVSECVSDSVPGSLFYQRRSFHLSAGDNRCRCTLRPELQLQTRLQTLIVQTSAGYAEVP
jgi:hypothetical protein